MAAYLESDTTGYDAQQGREETDAISIKPEPENTYLSEIFEFSSALIENRAPLNNESIGLQSQKVLAACYKSVETGNAEKVN